jgi:lysophospholipase L1-like esterase
MRHRSWYLPPCLLAGLVLTLACLATEPAPKPPATPPAPTAGATSGAEDDALAAQWKAKLDYVASCKKLTEQIQALPDWVEPMKAVHARFKGKPGVFVCWGDSISQQAQYWSPLKNGGTGMDPAMQQAYTLIKSYMRDECWGWKGSKYGNEGGMTSLWGKDNVDKWLKEMNPEAVILLFGANDQDRSDKLTPQQKMADCLEAMETIVKKSLDNGTVVIMTTMAPRKNRRCDIYSEQMVKLAGKYHLPVCDYLGAILQRRPTDWDGSLPQFSEFHDRSQRFEAPTLISGDGEHPSAPKAFLDDYSEEGLKTNGCGLHTYVTALAYAEVIHKVFGMPLPEGKK